MMDSIRRALGDQLYQHITKQTNLCHKQRSLLASQPVGLKEVYLSFFMAQQQQHVLLSVLRFSTIFRRRKMVEQGG